MAKGSQKMNRNQHELDPIERIRAICMALPEAEEKPFGGQTAPSFRVKDKLFVTTYEDASAMTCKAAPGVQQELVGSEPGRFFVPPYVGHRGWVGAYLGVEQDWDELAELMIDSYRMTAPPRLRERVSA
jgi:predicted DNA-binding protein (MmcQ/YjbR family)